MLNNLQHILLTRFNVKVKWKNSKKSNKRVSDEWMDQRIHLFQKYCLPSIVNQSNQNFSWFIYMDSETKTKYKEKIYNLSKSEQLFEIKYVNDMSGVINSLQEILYSCKCYPDFLLTTRLDNDDALHKKAIERIQSEALGNIRALNTQQNKLAINLERGYSLKVEPRIEVLTRKKNVSSPFISLLEKIEFNQNVDTVMRGEHTSFYYQQDFPLIQIDDDSYWLQIIHTKNVSNQLDGLPTLKKEVLESFAIDTNNLSLRKIDYFWYLTRYSVKSSRLFLGSLLRKLRLK